MRLKIISYWLCVIGHKNLTEPLLSESAFANHIS